ncbi:hypothetical protein JOF48_003619 [Arthrobacter stackebrandtii]|uniref:Uncharacterized protein n=1 Tax=Arthrobacter stackebrandtii TaxID=272161 RepID=A0ABS4Z1B6_9MICC|nr:hypothetical protein [Arthrobacter stackebrandtii]MBP2414820.1 hypothetical protein [Arthrobacter stackebrandtii]PYG99479.1 hypothetical protein CVV67_15295 [Arthrobacter stackebrandtii]
MNTLIRKFLDFFTSSGQEPPAAVAILGEPDGMPLASAAYLREFAHRLGLEVDDLSPAEQSELKRRLDDSMDFREENYSRLYHGVYELGHGYSLDDAQRVSARINEISAEPAAGAYLDYRENAVAAEALMAAGALLRQEGDLAAGARLFQLADARRHRSSLLSTSVAALTAGGTAQLAEGAGQATAVGAGATADAGIVSADKAPGEPAGTSSGSGTARDGSGDAAAQSGIAMLMADRSKDAGDSAPEISEPTPPHAAAGTPGQAPKPASSSGAASDATAGGDGGPAAAAGTSTGTAGSSPVSNNAPKAAPKAAPGQKPVKKNR